MINKLSCRSIDIIYYN